MLLSAMRSPPSASSTTEFHVKPSVCQDPSFRYISQEKPDSSNIFQRQVLGAKDREHLIKTAKTANKKLVYRVKQIQNKVLYGSTRDPHSFSHSRNGYSDEWRPVEDHFLRKKYIQMFERRLFEGASVPAFSFEEMPPATPVPVPAPVVDPTTMEPSKTTPGFSGALGPVPAATPSPTPPTRSEHCSVVFATATLTGVNMDLFRQAICQMDSSELCQLFHPEMTNQFKRLHSLSKSPKQLSRIGINWYVFNPHNACCSTVLQAASKTKKKKKRDFVLLEMQNAFMDEKSRRGFCHSMNSAELPWYKNAEATHDLVRARIYSSGIVIMETCFGSEELEVSCLLQMDLKGNEISIKKQRQVVAKQVAKSIDVIAELLKKHKYEMQRHGKDAFRNPRSALEYQNPKLYHQQVNAGDPWRPTVEGNPHGPYALDTTSEDGSEQVRQFCVCGGQALDTPHARMPNSNGHLRPRAPVCVCGYGQRDADDSYDSSNPNSAFPSGNSVYARYLGDTAVTTTTSCTGDGYSSTHPRVSRYRTGPRHQAPPTRVNNGPDVIGNGGHCSPPSSPSDSSGNESSPALELSQLATVNQQTSSSSAIRSALSRPSFSSSAAPFGPYGSRINRTNRTNSVLSVDDELKMNLAAYEEDSLEPLMLNTSKWANPFSDAHATNDKTTFVSVESSSPSSSDSSDSLESPPTASAAPVAAASMQASSSNHKNRKVSSGVGTFSLFLQRSMTSSSQDSSVQSRGTTSHHHRDRYDEHLTSVTSSASSIHSERMFHSNGSMMNSVIGRGSAVKVTCIDDNVMI